MKDFKGFRDLIVFQKSYALSIKIFQLIKTFPKDEKYALTDQILRSSRSVPTNIAEAWAKRIYPKAFVSKLSDALAEELETEVWLDFSKDHQYITDKIYLEMMDQYDEIRKMLISIINNPDKFCK